MKFKLIIIILLVLGTGAISYMIVFEKNEFDITNKKTERKIEAIELFYKFENDENAANKLFLGKIIEITGIVSEIQNSQNNETLVIFKDDEEVFGVACTFKNANSIKMLEVGNKITVKGICQGFLTDVVVNNCVLIN